MDTELIKQLATEVNRLVSVSTKPLCEKLAKLQAENDRFQELLNNPDIEKLAEAVHKAYCAQRIKEGKEPYWTGGDYSKLDEATKDYDRATVRAVLRALKGE